MRITLDENEIRAAILSALNEEFNGTVAIEAVKLISGTLGTTAVIEYTPDSLCLPKGY